MDKLSISAAVTGLWFHSLVLAGPDVNAATVTSAMATGAVADDL